ncbi:unnamed protein product [Cochlearia groenlandica]
MAVSEKWTSKIISVIATSLFALIIVFQIPLFRVGCMNNVCHSPLEVISSHLIATQIVPSSCIKPLLYLGSLSKSLLLGYGLPTYPNLDITSTSPFSTHLEVFAGCLLCLLGALLSIFFKPTRLSFIGTLLIYWGLIRDILLLDSSSSSPRLYPTLFLSSLSAFLSVQSDVRKILRCFISKPISKSL